MANIKISDLTSAASVSGTQQFEVNESGTSKKVTGAQIATYVEGEISSSPTFTGVVTVPAGSAAAPSITVTGDTNTGIYFPAADTVGISTGGTLRVSVNSSGSLVTTGDIEVGNVSDTTLSRLSAGVIAVEGKALATLLSPIFTGTPTGPTAAVDTNTTQLATTAYVVGQGYAKLASPTLTGTPTAPTAAAGTNTTQLATTGFVTGNFLRQALQNTWSTLGTIANVVGLLSWKNYGNNHVIFDASNGTSPSGGAVNNTTADVAWTGSYPTLMGWNGVSTYGVRVDVCRLADTVTTISTAQTLNATAAASVGAVGTYALLRFISSTAASPGTTHNGSSLYYASASGGVPGNISPAGTWRLMGACNTSATNNDAFASLFLRIS